MQLSAIRFAGDIRVSTVADNRPQAERLHALFDMPRKKGQNPAYFEAQQPLTEFFKSVSIGEIQVLFARLTKQFPAAKQKPTLSVGHNLMTATIDYGVNPGLRTALHQALSTLGAKYIDSDGDEILQPGTQVQLHDQYLEQFGLPLEREILTLLKDKNLTLAVVESATGGLTSSRLTDIKGSSYCITHNIVTYSNEAKTKAVGVNAKHLAKHGPYNERTAREMSIGIRKETGAKVGLSFTGLAGCNRWGEEFSGVCFIGLSGLTPKPIVKRVQVDANLPRKIKKELFSEYGLMFLKQYLEGKLQG